MNGESAKQLRETKNSVDMLCGIAFMLMTVQDAEALVAEIEKTDAVMPFFSPTDYLKVSATLLAHLELARAFLEFRRRIGKQIAVEERKDEHSTGR